MPLSSLNKTKGKYIIPPELYLIYLFLASQIFLKVASNVNDGKILREIQFEDVTDHGRYATRVHLSSASSR